MNLLYLTFGNDTSIHLQAAFSIYSFLSENKQVNTVNIITDNASFYSHLGKMVHIITINKEEIIEWQGEYNFFWRIKIKAIEKLCHLYPGEPIVYLDTDTFLYNNIEFIQQTLSNNGALMHINEGFLSEKNSKTEKKMWQQIAGKKFGDIIMHSKDSMWNAGVVATPNTQNGNDLILALKICDEMCANKVSKRLIEQYALSLALDKTYGLVEAKSSIAHYWATKQLWNIKISALFLEAYFAQWGDAAIIKKVNLLSKERIPVFERVKNTNLRLKVIIDKLFPIKNIQFLFKK